MDESVGVLLRALEIQPAYAEAHNNLGAAWKQLCRLSDAEECYYRAIELEPEFAEAHVNRATLELLHGQFEEGWEDFEWRWRTGEILPRSYCQRQWAGEAIAGRTILLWGNQGFGDTLQFIRYARLVKELAAGARVIVEC